MISFIQQSLTNNATKLNKAPVLQQMLKKKRIRLLRTRVEDAYIGNMHWGHTSGEDTLNTQKHTHTIDCIALHN